MKEMIYEENRKIEILHSEEYKGRKFVVLSLGTHPTAYVELKEEELKKSSSYSDYDLEVHGGFTYLGNAGWDKEDKLIYIGWDYAHCGDYCGYNAPYYDFINMDEKKWTTQEIIDEAKNVIDQFEKAKWVGTKQEYILRVEEDE